MAESLISDFNRLAISIGQEKPRFGSNLLYVESEEIFSIELKQNNTSENRNVQTFEFTDEQIAATREYGYEVMAQVCMLKNKPCYENGYPEGLRFILQANVYDIKSLEEKLVIHRDQLENKRTLQAKITTYVRKKAEVGVEFRSLNNCKYFLSVFLVEPYDKFMLFNTLRAEGYINKAATRNVIKTLFSKYEAQDVAQCIKVSLICPLTRKRLGMSPSRGTQCNHVQCFEGVSFLQMMQVKPKWQCPICSNYLPYGELKMDRYILKVLDAVNGKCNSVYISEDGSWCKGV